MGFIDKLNTPVAVVVVLVFFLAVDGFLSYRYQQHLQSAGNGATDRPTAVADPVTVEETTSPGQGLATTAETTTAASAAAVGETTAQPPAAPNVLRVAVRVEGAPSWLRIQEDGQTVLEQVSESGFSREFEADREVSIETGNAGAVRVEVNGQNLGSLGTSGEVATRTYTA